MEDRSLDDYLGGGTDDEDDAPDDPSGGDGPDGVDPATPTYRWTSEGTACTACGASVERGWFDGGAFVCADCKEW